MKLNTVTISSNTMTRAALVTTSGLALALAFPKFDVSLLAWVAFVPFFYAVEGEPLKNIFWWGWLQGLACYVGSLYWVVITLNEFAGVNFILSLIPMVLLAGVVGSFTAVSMWTGEFCARRLRIPLVITMPIAWAAVELMRTYFPIGFPWNLLGETQYRNLALIQFAEFTGSYGISALIIFFNVVIFMVRLRRGSPRLQTISLSILTVLMVAAIGFGNWRTHELKSIKPAGSFRVAMVQGDIPQSVKWDANALAPTFKIYTEQSEQGAKQGADLIVWPEAAATFIFQPDDRYPVTVEDDAAYRTALLQLARDLGKPILFGAPALVVHNDHVTGFANRAYLVSAQGQVAAWYDKIQLVPFGEYVPYRALLGYFVNRIVHGMGDMVPGERQTLFDVNGAKLSVLICYESIFPDLARRSVKEGADVMVNITNDAWYGTSSAPYQLLAMAAMRSVETKVPMIRVANTGISAIILDDGSITATTPLFKRGTEIEDVAWHPMRTLYTVIGDVFADLCAILTAIALMFGWLRPRKLKPLEAHVETILSSRNGKRVAIN
ncbi:MAG TPA: apolipoprotein N-acyltransferase [Candidatus Binataceae bacterium]|nr:apolipoprotein N-acyltransferase [Candidatus Binataceae bacterium]